MSVGCMGGFCAKRERCRHYHQTTTRTPIERLCEKGDDDAYTPIRWVSQSEWTKPKTKTETEPA